MDNLSTPSESSRRSIGLILKEISSAVGKNFQLNDQGVCSFIYDSFTIVVEVPESGTFFVVYTTLCELKDGTDPEKKKDQALKLNYLQQETKGGCLSLDSTSAKIYFSYTDKVHGITAPDFRDILENFIETTMALHRCLSSTSLSE